MEVSFIYILSNIFLWVFDVCVCVCVFSYVCVCLCVCVPVLFIHTISVSIICVSQEKPSLMASNKHIYDFCKWIIKKKKHCGK